MDAENLKVLHILTVRYGANGITRCAMNYITHFPHARADLACGFPLPAGVPEAFAARGARAVSLLPRLKRPLSYGHQLKKLIREEQYDLVEIHGNSCTMALELLSAKAGGARVRIPHAHNTHCSMKMLHKLLRPAFERLRTAAFACGREAGAFLYEGKPFTVVKNAVDTAAFAFSDEMRTRLRGELGLDGCLVIGHVGGFVEQKNHAFLIEIFRALHAQNPNAVLLMVGDGPLRAGIEQTVKSAGLSDAVRFLPARDDVAALYSAMDIFVLPSLFEGLPFTLIEAQASGLGCLAASAVTREAAMSPLVRFMDADARADNWADAILSMERPARAQASMEAAKSIAAGGYAIDTEAAALEALYLTLLDEARA